MTANATIPFGLTLRPADGTAAPAAAWFIVGVDPADWLAELVRWNIPLVNVRLYPVPTSGRTREPCGVLAITAGKPSVVRALPYAALGGRLFFPADATVTPPVSSDELSAALRHDLLVLHPSAGLVGFATNEAVEVHQLLAPLPRAMADWSHADAGPEPLPRLVSVEAEPLAPDLAAMIEMGRDDIGSAADDELPPTAEETAAAEAAAQRRSGVFGFITSIFTGGVGRQAADSLQDKRQRELNRLLEMLKKDPDAGLQHALPLRDYATRGRAPASGVLGRRDVSFNLRNLSGGNQRGDSWSMADQMRQQLTAQYREAANRELNLGRHRRAAYIFAHLLADYAAAADALKQGRHFREAAALYREQLKNPRAATDCLAAGGLLTEAIPLYWELLQYEIAGDLYAKLGEPATAADCYRHAVRQAQDRNDPVAAARLLAGKLAAPDEALALLAETWPESDKAATCLGEWFTIAGRNARHEAASARVAQLRDGDLPPHRSVALVEGLSVVARTYPEGMVRHRAADVTRVLVGRRLANADSVDRRAMVRAVVALVPGDKLLARDGTRFLQPPTVRPTKPTIPLKPESTVVRTFQLPEGHQWRTVVAVPGGFLALGVRDTRCTLVRGLWGGLLQTRALARDTNADRAYTLIAPVTDRRVILAALAGVHRPGFESIQLPRADGFMDDLTVSSPRYFGENVVGACRAESGTVWVWGNETLSAYGPDDRVLSTYDLPCPDVDPAVRPVPMAARNKDVYIAGGRSLYRWSSEAGVREIHLPGDVRSLVPSPPLTAQRMLVTFDDGWGLVRDMACQAQGRQLVRPAVTFTPDGYVIAVGQGTANAYRQTLSGPTFDRGFEVPVRSPVAVLPAGSAQAAAFDVDGTVCVFRYLAR